MGSGARIAFFGGSFDPPHLGHLAIARAARDTLALDSVLFAPVGAQPLKPQGSSASFADRIRMTELAIADEPGFSISYADAPHPAGKPNYTLATLRRLKAEMPGYAELFCLMGADSLMNLRHWRDAAQIPLTAAVIVASRPGQQWSDLAELLPEGLALCEAANASPHSGPLGGPNAALEEYCVRSTNGASAPLYVLPHVDVPISATDLRRELDKSSIPPAVLRYIREHGLYGSMRLARS
jgi:nicotinate-nucleotide adenylyltransferase